MQEASHYETCRESKPRQIPPLEKKRANIGRRIISRISGVNLTDFPGQ